MAFYPQVSVGATIEIRAGAAGTSGTSVASVFTAHMTDFDPFSLERAVVDVTWQNDAANTAVGVIDTAKTQYYRRKLPGFADCGNLECGVIHDTQTVPPVNESNGMITIVMPKGPQESTTANQTFACDGFVASYAPTGPLGDALTARMTIALSGAPTFATAAV